MWTSIHIYYYDVKQFDKLLGLIDETGTLRLPFFFVRYWYGGPHLRIRYWDICESQKAWVMSAIKGILREHPSTEKIEREQYYSMYSGPSDGSSLPWYDDNRIIIDTYEPEVERYNGEAMMQLSERQFIFSSQYVLWLIRSKRLSDGTRQLVSLESALYMILAMGLNVHQMVSYLYSYVVSTLAVYVPHEVARYLAKFEERFQFHRDTLKKCIELCSETQDHTFYKQYCSFTKEVVNALEEGVFRLNAVNLSSIFDSSRNIAVGQLYWSWIHMHFNRLGLSPIIEAETLFFIYRTLQSGRD